MAVRHGGGEAPAAQEVRANVVVRPLEERDIEEADRVMRIAFGTYLNVPQPEQMFGDADYVRTRYRADPAAAFCAELNGEIVGSNLATRRGSFGFFGPLSVRPDLWDQGVATRLMQPVMELFESWGVRHAGLFTFPGSTKHVALYNKFGFWPQELTPVLETQLGASAGRLDAETFSAAREQGSAADVLEQCRQVAGSVYDGLDLEPEIVAADTQALGDTLLLYDADRLVGFAVCHYGAGSEAGSGACTIKFGAIAAGKGAAARFERLIDNCEAFAGAKGLARLVAGVSIARRGAYRALVGRGYRARLNGLTMLRPDDPGFYEADTYVLDDLR